MKFSGPLKDIKSLGFGFHDVVYNQGHQEPLVHHFWKVFVLNKALYKDILESL